MLQRFRLDTYVGKWVHHVGSDFVEIPCDEKRIGENLPTIHLLLATHDSTHAKRLKAFACFGSWNSRPHLHSRNADKSGEWKWKTFGIWSYQMIQNHRRQADRQLTRLIKKRCWWVRAEDKANRMKGNSDYYSSAEAQNVFAEVGPTSSAYGWEWVRESAEFKWMEFLPPGEDKCKIGLINWWLEKRRRLWQILNDLRLTLSCWANFEHFLIIRDSHSYT